MNLTALGHLSNRITENRYRLKYQFVLLEVRATLKMVNMEFLVIPGDVTVGPIVSYRWLSPTHSQYSQAGGKWPYLSTSHSF